MSEVNGGAYEFDPVVPFAPKTPLPMTPISSTEPGKPFWNCFTKLPVWPKQTVIMPLTWRRSFPISFARPKIGSRNWKLRLGFIRTKPTARSSGCTKSDTEVEDRFLRQDNSHGAMTGAPQRKRVRAE